VRSNAIPSSFAAISTTFATQTAVTTTIATITTIATRLTTVESRMRLLPSPASFMLVRNGKAMLLGQLFLAMHLV